MSTIRAPLALHFCIVITELAAAVQSRPMLHMCLWSSGAGGGSQVYTSGLARGRVENWRASWLPELTIPVFTNFSGNMNRMPETKLLGAIESQMNNTILRNEEREPAEIDIKNKCSNDHCKRLTETRSQDRESRFHHSRSEKPFDESNLGYEMNFQDCFNFALRRNLKFKMSQSSVNTENLRNYISPPVLVNDPYNFQSNLTRSDGIVLRVLHEVSGATLAERAFPTWELFTFGAHLGWWLEKLQPGRIACLTVRKLGMVGLWSVQHRLKEMGSVFVDMIPVADMWIWVWVVQGKTLVESTSNKKSNLFANFEVHLVRNHVLKTGRISNQIDFPTDTKQSVFSSTAIEISSKPLIKHVDEHQISLLQRKMYVKGIFAGQPSNTFANEIAMGRKLCNTLEGFGRFCSANFHATFLERINKPKGNIAPKIAIVLSAGVRLEYILHTTLHLFESIGIEKENVIAMVGRSFDTGHVNENILILLKSLTIPYRIISAGELEFKNSSNFAKSFSYYKSTWETALDYFGEEYQYFAFLDEDVQVSADWLHYLRYVAPLLDEDDSLWCVTSSNGARQKGGDPDRLFRAQRQPGWGYIVTRKTVSDASKEMNHGEVSLYDIWLMSNFARGRECIFPEVARSIHYGIGENTIPQIHQIYSLEVDLYKGLPVPMTPLHELNKSTYLLNLIKEIRKAKIYSEDPCKPNFLMKTSQHLPGPLVFPFYLPNDSGFLEWTMLAECIGLYGHARPNEPHYVVPVSLARNDTLYLIGIPMSPLSSLVSKVNLWRLRSDGDEAYFFYKLPTFENRTLNILEGNVFKSISI